MLVRKVLFVILCSLLAQSYLLAEDPYIQGYDLQDDSLEIDAPAEMEEEALSQPLQLGDLSNFSILNPQTQDAEKNIQEGAPPKVPYLELLMEKTRFVKSNYLEMLILRASMDEMGFNKDTKNLEKRATLLNTLEEMIVPFCAPQVFVELKHLGASSEPECKQLLERIFELDPASPYALCARDGLNSQTCRLSYDQQIIVSRSLPTPPVPSSLAGALHQSQESQIAPKIAKHTVDLRRANEQLEAIKRSSVGKTPIQADLQPIRQEIYKAHAGLINLLCRNSRLELKHTTNQSDSNPRSILGTSPSSEATPTLPPSLSALDLASIGITPRPIETPVLFEQRYQRIRVLSPACRQSIDSARAFDKNFATASCAEIGSFSPQCIQALERSKRQREMQEKLVADGVISPRSQQPKTEQNPGQLATF